MTLEQGNDGTFFLAARQILVFVNSIEIGNYVSQLLLLYLHVCENVFPVRDRQRLTIGEPEPMFRKVCLGFLYVPGLHGINSALNNNICTKFYGHRFCNFSLMRFQTMLNNDYKACLQVSRMLVGMPLL